MTNKPLELHHDDFDDGGRDLVWMAGAHLVGEAHDLVHHPARLRPLRRIRGAGERERDQ